MLLQPSNLQWLASYFKAVTVAEYPSRFNGVVRVVLLSGALKTVVGELTQSGGLVKQLWQRALHLIPTPPKRVLLLGLGVGTSATLISKRWPSATITGVDIDPAVLAAGRDYFGLATIPHLTIVRGDIFSWLPRHRGRYDLILVDIFTGRTAPKKLETAGFVRELHKHLTDRGMVICNRLVWGEGEKVAAERFVALMRRSFSTVTITPLLWKFNWLIEAR